MARGRRVVWLESFYLLTRAILSIDSDCYILTREFKLLTRVMLFIDSSHSIFWVVSEKALGRASEKQWCLTDIHILLYHHIIYIAQIHSWPNPRCYLIRVSFKPIQEGLAVRWSLCSHDYGKYNTFWHFQPQTAIVNQNFVISLSNW